MLSLRRFFVLVLVTAPVFACQGGTSKCDVDSPCASETLELCDGSDQLRFAGTTGGGNLGGVPRVVAEVGWSFLLVDGGCRYWSMTEPDGPVRTGTLDPSQEAEFTAALELGRWDPEPIGPMGCFDGPTTILRFLDDETSTSCGLSPPVMVAYDDWLETLHAAGTDLDGEARYSLSDASTDSWVVGNNTNLAEPWPLENDPALLDPFEEDSAEPMIASVADAQALRAARNLYGARSSTVGPRWRTPMVLEASGAEPLYFNLAMRDVTPFERDGELAVDDFFAP
jgi:hypothetical protein